MLVLVNVLLLLLVLTYVTIGVFTGIILPFFDEEEQNWKTIAKVLVMWPILWIFMIRDKDALCKYVLDRKNELDE